MAMASEMNKHLPMMVDAETRFDNVLAVNKNIIYSYTLVNSAKADLDSNDFKSVLSPTILTKVKTAPEMKDLRDQQVSFVYRYSDKNSEYVATIIVTSEMYLN